MKLFKIRYSPTNFIWYGLIITTLFYLLGPYDYEIRNWWSIAYLVLAFTALLAGIWFGKRVCLLKPTLTSNDDELFSDFKLSSFSKLILIVVEQGCFLLTAVYIIYYIFIYGGGSYELGDNRAFSSDLPMFLKVVQSALYTTVGCYIMFSYSSNTQTRFYNFLSKAGLACPIISGLVNGARWSTFVILIILYVVEKTKGEYIDDSNLDDRTGKNTNSNKKKINILFVIAIAYVGYIVFMLFAIRGVLESYISYMPYYGNIEVKEIWNVIGNSSLGKPIFNIFFYFSQSVPYYSVVFPYIDIPRLHWGMYLFRILSFFFPSLVSYSYMDMVYEIPCLCGLYTPFVTGYLRDFGWYLTPIMIFLTGVCMGRIYMTRHKSILSRIMFPYILTMCILAQMYYIWHVGNIDFMIFTNLIIYAIVIFFNKHTVRDKY